jgi:secondary thiamine-phosphate synthase enzyme
MKCYQATFRLRPRPRGFHLVTDEIASHLPRLGEVQTGVLHLFLQHTSASLSINENADPDVRRDLAYCVDKLVAAHEQGFVHTAEGPDDMPAHVKASLLGCAVSVPLQGGRLALGTWQGIYLGEHRDHGGGRSVVATLMGI